MKLQLLDLFSGIGGFSLGLEATGGFETVAFCEIDPYARAVLGTHWPGVPIYDDVRALTGDALRRDGIAVDAICGGFPCQDLSFAGRRAGLEGARSGLWSEYARLIGELRPRFVIVENVPGLLSLGMGAVLGDLAALGYDAVWDCVPASAVGAPHRRDRVWIVAHAPRDEQGRQIERPERERARESRQPIAAPSHANGQGEHDGAEHAEVGGSPELVADAEIKPEREQADEAHAVTARRQARHEPRDGRRHGGALRDANVSGLALREGQSRDVGEKLTPSLGADWWLTEPDVGRVADGVPDRAHRLRCLGNAVVPQIPYLLGKAVLEGLRQ